MHGGLLQTLVSIFIQIFRRKPYFLPSISARYAISFSWISSATDSYNGRFPAWRFYFLLHHPQNVGELLLFSTPPTKTVSALPHCMACMPWNRASSDEAQVLLTVADGISGERVADNTALRHRLSRSTGKAEPATASWIGTPCALAATF